MKRFLWYQSPFVVACVAIFAVSSLSRVPEVPLPILQDKIPHAIVFGVLAVLAHRAFLNQARIRILQRLPALSALLFSLFYGALDEFHQSFVPGRTPDVWDLVADVVGAAAGLTLFWFMQKRIVQRRASAGGTEHGL